ncbi:hypothetical protein [Micromonospora sp. NPDC049799]|uniref:hypothetical protein n=1 Tax=Micromonospora sp. NPDC049799 TaxID=3154741 RepID=UPI0033EE9360
MGMGLDVEERNEGPFEWWYFQHVSTDFVVVVTAQVTNILGGGRNSPRLSVSFYHLDAPVSASWAIPIRRLSLNWDGYLSVDRHVVERNDGFDIHVVADGMTLDVQIDKSSDPWGPRDDEIATSSAGGRSAKWRVRLPRGKSQARIEFAGRRFKGAGYAYHDRNWGTLPIFDVFSGWSWATVVAADSTLVIARLINSSGNVGILSNGRSKEFEEWFGRAEDPNTALSVDAELPRTFEEAFGCEGAAGRIRLVKAKTYVAPSYGVAYYRWLLVGTDREQLRICGVAEAARLQGSG